MKDISLFKEIREYFPEINDNAIETFHIYVDDLLVWNENINLTAITDKREIAIKHFLDSLLIMKSEVWKNKGKVIDIGTGAGFPGMPLKIVNNDIEITLLDSLQKRLKFLEEEINKFNLKKIEIKHGRAEDIGRDENYREKYDFALSRAVANLSVLIEYSLPLIKKDGFFIAYKGPEIEDEIKNAKNALKELGGSIESIEKHIIPFENSTRNILIIKKNKTTPKIYPRKAGTPKKRPL